MKVDPRAWLVWVAATAVIASLTRNPLYLIVILLAVSVVEVECASYEQSIVPLSILRFGLFVIPLAGSMNALMIHAGDTVLFRLPDVLPVIGGNISLEAFLYGVANGLSLTVLFAAFMTLSSVVPVHHLVKLTPRAFHEGGVVISIALTFLPHMIASFRRIKQAQAIRGHRVRGIRDWLPIVLPLLISGLERGMGLAEAMVARGYGAVSDEEQGLGLRLGLTVSLLSVLIGWMIRSFLTQYATAGLILIVAGGAFLIFMIWRAGRNVAHTQYRPRRWRAIDTLVITGCGISILLMVLSIPGVAKDSLNYYPYPRVSYPGFDPLIGVGLLGFLVPVMGYRSAIFGSKEESN